MIHVEASEARERPLRVAAGHPPAACAEAAAMDRQASDRRDRAEKRIAALGEMTGGVAHDFRNILAAIDAALRLAERQGR
jgi:signal transduction histidine kinase